MLAGQMMHMPMLISSILQHAATFHADTEIVSRLVEGSIHRYSYREAAQRSRQLANALMSLGVQTGECIGTLAWNTHRHLEIYYAVSGSGRVCHTVNPRLFEDQIEYIINHAQDQVLFFDLNFLPLVERLEPLLKSVRHYVVMTDAEHCPPKTTLPNLIVYEDLIHKHSDQYEWPTFDENCASSLCYTSGTTGHPKGVLYSHRSTVLHAISSGLPDALGISAQDCVMPVVPMFHVNAWGIPYSAILNGAKLVLPGARLDGEYLYELIEEEHVSLSLGVPTVWMTLLAYCEKHHLHIHSLNRVVIGGSALSSNLIEQLAKHQVEARQLWGMTELSPCGTTAVKKYKHHDMPVADQMSLMQKQGRPLYGVNIRIVDDQDLPLPHDGKAFGHLQVKGPWVLSQYFKRELDDNHTADGWFKTGDVVTIDADGYMKITDRTKDVIKSGGEWISSIELENILVSHPAVAEAAAIGVAHPKWDERPLMVVVLKERAQATEEELLAFFEGKIAKWWTPDHVVIVDELPHTATGKLLKMKLREQFKAYLWSE